MSVDTVLNKMVAHNANVLGCIATHGERLHHNLPDRYDLVDQKAVTEYANLMFQASDELETEHDPFDQMFLEYHGHGLYARRLDDGVLVLLTEPMERTQFKKAQIGVNLFLKPLKKALDEGPAEPTTAPVTGAPALSAEPDEAPETGQSTKQDGAVGNPITKTKRRRWF